MRELALEPNGVVVGNKEGKILMIDVRNGEIVWKYAVGKSSVI
jgi:outer membrane protein assembly factor BamB